MHVVANCLLVLFPGLHGMYYKRYRNYRQSTNTCYASPFPVIPQTLRAYLFANYTAQSKHYHRRTEWIGEIANLIFRHKQTNVLWNPSLINKISLFYLRPISLSLSPLSLSSANTHFPFTDPNSETDCPIIEPFPVSASICAIKAPNSTATNIQRSLFIHLVSPID